MSTPVDSANLILKLYELRREAAMRQARASFTSEFNRRVVQPAPSDGARHSSW
jgi:hypothetical protein